MTAAAGSAGEDVLRRLRAETADLHRRLEDGLALVGPDGGTPGPARYHAVLARFHGFHAVLEPRLDGWAAGPAAAPVGLDWPARRKLHHLSADLRALGTPDPAGLPRCPDVPAVRGTGDALGALYVVEGATLGGQVILRHLRRDGVVPAAATTFFGAYGDQVGRFWHGWRAAVRRWVGAPGSARADEVVGAAVETFAAFEHWCRPVYVAPARQQAAS